MIEYQDVGLTFDGKMVFENLSLTIDRGAKVVIQGKSGCGKTSLLGMLLGFTHPDKGSVFLDGQRIDENSVWNIRRRVAYVDQDGSIGDGQVLDTVHNILRLKNNSHIRAGDEDVYRLMDDFELDPALSRNQIGDLSGGERQRVAIVISLLLRREVYLLDEVTSALDKPLKKKVAEHFLGREDLTAMIVSHDPVWLEYPTVEVFDLEDKRWKP